MKNTGAKNDSTIAEILKEYRVKWLTTVTGDWEAEFVDLLAQALQKAIDNERNSWLNQPANEHDARIRADERIALIEQIEREVIGEEEPFFQNDGPIKLSDEEAFKQLRYIVVRNKLRVRQRAKLTALRKEV